MDDKLYVKIKLALLKYDYDQPSSFGDLFEYSKQFKHGKTFKNFVRICQNMGVSSHVVRFEDGLKRVLKYDKFNDKYVKGEIKVLTACDHCKGTGVVETPIEITL